MANKEDNKITSNSGQTYSSIDKVGTQKDKLPTKKLSHGSNLDESNQIKDNAQKIHDLAGVAAKSPHPVASTAGKAVRGIDKATGGKASEALAKPITKMQNKIPEPVKKAAKIASPTHGLNNGNDSRLREILDKRRNNAPAPSNNEDDKKKDKEKGGDQKEGSLPSSNSNKKSGLGDKVKNALGPGKEEKSEEKGEEKNTEMSGSFQMTRTMKIVVFGVLPFALFLGVILLITTILSTRLSDYAEAFGISMFMGEDTGNVEYESSKEQEEFYQRVKEVKEEYQANGKNVDALKIVSVFHSLNLSDAKFDYDEIGKSEIREVADLMFENNAYNEEKFKENLLNVYFPKQLPKLTEAEREEKVDEVFDYIERYYDFIEKKSTSSACASIGSCVYDIKGFYINGKGNVTKNIQVSDLYVQLMQCGVANGHNYGGTFGQPLAEEELVPFETYILGVAYQEIGDDAPEEAFKAQLIAARSYALARPTEMGGWRSLEQDSSGRWILKAASCTQDQVYCNPDKGCSSPISMQWGQVYSGTDKGVLGKNPLPQDSPLRRYAAETQGQVLVNSNGNIVYTDFNNDVQNSFKNNANSGLDYKQILLSHYSQASDIQQASCNDGSSSSGCVGSTGEFSKWKQYEGDWADTVYVGSSGRTIHEIGCLATSVSMLVAKSGVPVNVDPLNPGTFVNYLNEHNGFDSGGNFQWASVSNVAPTFHFVDKVSVDGMTREEKLAKINELVNQPNTYVVAEVKGNTGQHWVAIDGVNGNNVMMMDPGSPSTDMWSQYNWNNTSTLAYFRVS